jgi:hypothetical protein
MYFPGIVSYKKLFKMFAATQQQNQATFDYFE